MAFSKENGFAASIVRFHFDASSVAKREHTPGAKARCPGCAESAKAKALAYPEATAHMSKRLREVSYA